MYMNQNTFFRLCTLGTSTQASSLNSIVNDPIGARKLLGCKMGLLSFTFDDFAAIAYASDGHGDSNLRSGRILALLLFTLTGRSPKLGLMESLVKNVCRHDVTRSNIGRVT